VRKVISGYFEMDAVFNGEPVEPLEEIIKKISSYLYASVAHVVVA